MVYIMDYLQLANNLATSSWNAMRKLTTCYSHVIWLCYQSHLFSISSQVPTLTSATMLQSSPSNYSSTIVHTVQNFIIKCLYFNQYKRLNCVSFIWYILCIHSGKLIPTSSITKLMLIGDRDQPLHLVTFHADEHKCRIYTRAHICIPKVFAFDVV